MIYIIQLNNIDNFKKEFPVFKEITIDKHTVLHVSTSEFLQLVYSQTNNLNKFQELMNILKTYPFIQIEEI